MENIQLHLKSIGWIKIKNLFYLQNNCYVICIEFQKSRFSDSYYINMFYVHYKNDKKYKRTDSALSVRLTNKYIGFTEYNQLPDQTSKLILKINKLTNDFLKIGSRKEMINFIKNEILIGEADILPIQKEQIDTIPEYNINS